MTKKRPVPDHPPGARTGVDDEQHEDHCQSEWCSGQLFCRIFPPLNKWEFDNSVRKEGLIPVEKKTNLSTCHLFHFFHGFLINRSFCSCVHSYLAYKCKRLRFDTNLEQFDLHSKSSKVCIKTRSLRPSLPCKGQVTEQTTAKWRIAHLAFVITTIKRNFYPQFELKDKSYKVTQKRYEVNKRK